MQQKRSKPRKRKFSVRLLAAIAVIILAFLAMKVISDTGYQALNPNDTKFKTVTIKEGSTPLQMGETMQKQNIIRSAKAFASYSKKYGSEKLIAGTYLLSAAQDVPSIYNQMTLGPSAAPQLPKGYAFVGNNMTPEQAAQSMAGASSVSSAKIVAAYDDKSVIKDMQQKYPQLLSGIKPNGKNTDKLYNYVTPGIYKLSGVSSVDALMDKLLSISNDSLKPYYKKMEANGIQSPLVINLISSSGGDEFDRRLAFIQKIAPYAQELFKEYGVLPSISIAQAAHESNWDNSKLSSKYNNFYGVKTQDTTPGKSVVLETTEDENGETVTQKARFAVYTSWKQSMKAHAKTLAQGNTWNPTQFQDVLAAKNYKEAAKALYDDHYATDTNYTTLLTNLIESWNLQRYDK
ncbi:endolytic transglycosylase MltG [Eupransor demetentiae]|uniref:Flagellum-specific peptidoglycan hydrolase FlgJ (FlgJ) n=1 Tax=Eupransor demetentiae TaxID=3109584 RepID=A0ABM9N2Z6_9LACO|nr:Flagellum-specific peptidoglycan hydrolase FlgJ (FlgJ) [Lactobacillaceae bacterium LMG 33000]